MSQSYTTNCFQGDHAGTSDLQDMENNFAALKSSFSGSGAPSVDVVAGQLWFHTTNKILKVRDNANSSWLGIMYGDTSQRMWVHRNSAPDGWVVYSSITDVVLAVKGGSQAYNVAGGTQAGTWTQPNHTLTVSEMPAHAHGGNTGGQSQTHTHNINIGNAQFGSQTHAQKNTNYSSTTTVADAGNASQNHTHSIASHGGGGAHNHGTTYRPRAAVGTLQRLNI